MGFLTVAEVTSAQLPGDVENPLIDAGDLLAAEVEAADIAIPEVPVTATLYVPDGTTQPGSAEITTLEQDALNFCLALGASALEHGNPPVGAVLLDNDRGLVWAAMTVDKTTPDVLGHGELRAYNLARPTVGNQLEDCTLVTTAQPCNTCTCPLAEANIGRIVFAAPRSAVYAVTSYAAYADRGLMRPRAINMPDLLRDGDTTTLAIQGHLARQALFGFATWAALRNMGKLQA